MLRALATVAGLLRRLSLDNAINWLVANHSRIYAVLAACALIVGTMEIPS